MIRRVVHYIDSAEFGGTEQALLHVLAGLNRRRWDPVLFHHAEPGISRVVKKAHELDIRSRELPRITRRRSRLTLLPRFVRMLSAEHPAVFHAHLNNPLACQDGLLAAGLIRVPAIVATAQLFLNRPLHRLTSAQLRIVTPIVHSYIAVSEHVAHGLREIFRIRANKITVVHNGIDIAEFRKPVDVKLRAALTRGQTEQPVILTAARLAEQKGHCHLLKAAALVPQAFFIFAGDGPDRARLQAQAQHLGLAERVIFLGYRDDISDLLACCDLFVLPSLFEGLPLSILEAMAAKKPVVASGVGGNDEAIVDGETGLLVPPADPAPLAGAIQRILSDSELARQLAARAEVRVRERFSAERMVARVAQVYEQVLTLDNGASDRQHGRP